MKIPCVKQMKNKCLHYSTMPYSIQKINPINNTMIETKVPGLHLTKRWHGWHLGESRCMAQYKKRRRSHDVNQQ